MAETSLITKYRPRAFNQVLGQDEVVRALERIVETNSAQCFLFIGPSGVGKTTLARIVAKAVGCTDGGIVEVNAAKYRSIEDMRELTTSAEHRPILSVSPKRAIIIDECHDLTSAAIESLLKPLEEPPPWQYWMLCTTEGEKIRGTVKTRAAVLNLKSVLRNDLSALLDYIVEQEKMDVPTEVIDICAAEADGSPRDAISNLVVCATCQTRADAVRLIKTVQGNSQAGDLALALAKGADWPRLIEIIQGMADANPEGVRQVVRAFFTNGILKTGKYDTNAAAILTAFGKPFASTDGMTPVILAVMQLMNK